LWRSAGNAPLSVLHRMRIKPNCSCYEGNTPLSFWTEVPAMVKVEVSGTGQIGKTEISDLDPTWEDQYYHCSWCGEEATVLIEPPMQPAVLDSTKAFECGCRLNDWFEPVDLCTNGMELWIAFKVRWSRYEEIGRSSLWAWLDPEGKAVKEHFAPEKQTNEGQRNFPLTNCSHPSETLDVKTNEDDWDACRGYSHSYHCRACGRKWRS